MLFRTSAALAVLSLSIHAFASSPLEQLRQASSAVVLPSIAPGDEATLETLLSRNLRNPARPESCPLASNQYADIVAKIGSIKELFRDSCGAEDPTRLDELYSGATAIQTELEAAGVDTSDVPTTIDGQEVGDVIQNINDIFLRGNCNFRDRSFLQNAADVIMRFSQLGLLVSNTNGLILSGGGLALSSILNLIHSLFDKRFNFEEAADRQSFIKLNCAFYDIRRDIENSGFMDVVTQTHFDDAQALGPLLTQLQSVAEGISQQQKAFEEAVLKASEAYLAQTLGDTPALQKNLQAAIAVLSSDLADAGETPANTRKLQVLFAMTQLHHELSQTIQDYLGRGLSDVVFLDQMALSEIAKYSEQSAEFAQLYAMPVAAYRDGPRSTLLFHLERMHTRVKELRASAQENWLNETIDGVAVKDFIAATKKTISDAAAGISDKQTRGTTASDKLKRMTSTRDFSGRDDGTENIVSILSDYDEIVDQIYGKWGDEFLKFTTNTSLKAIKQFNRGYNRFVDQHLDGNGTISAENISEFARLQACQDALPTRRDWKLAQSLAQQGHDFVVTNKELFHSGVPRLFLSWRGDRAGIHGFRSRFERIRDHFMSSVTAQDYLAGRPVTSDAMRLLQNKKHIGRSMIQVIEQRPQATQIQEVLERYKCNEIVVTD